MVKKKEWSINKIITLLMILVAVLSWGFAAAAYAHDVEGWRNDPVPVDGELPSSRRAAFLVVVLSALLDFIANLFGQIPNCIAVISSTFTDRLWIVIAFVLVEGAVFSSGFFLKRLEAKLAHDPKMPPPAKRKATKRRKRRRRGPDGRELD